ncbi:MAG TPA: DNA-3-methyladenine glycosylase 2 family protein [Actinomycetes bacterium]|nr:DNA-3-methyladenine glycosylase 2 family protein [Actinomycetes bacterium]
MTVATARAAASAPVGPAGVGPRERQRTWRPGRPVGLAAMLGPLKHGGGDPACYLDRAGGWWLACRTPDGTGTLRLSTSPHTGEILASAWGSAARWLLDGVPALLGAGDDPAGFAPRHPLIAESARRWPGWRVPRTRLVLASLIPAIIEQKVTGQEASRSWRELLWRFGEAAPGPLPPGRTRPLRVPPEPARLLAIPTWDWHRIGLDGGRVRAIRAAATVAARLEQTVDLPAAEAERRLRLVPGVGIWTAAEVRQRAHGDPDAVSVGDYHLSGMVGWALLGRKVDDAQMLELLAPYAGHRFRAVRYIELAGVMPPRRGPRFAGRDYRAC